MRVADPDGELLARVLERDPHIGRKVKVGPIEYRGRRPLMPQERKFIDGVLEHGDPKRAAIDAGYAPASARGLMQRPTIKTVLTTQMRRAEMRQAGVNLDRSRLLQELDWAINQSKRAARRVHVISTKCPNCKQVVELRTRAAPREVANLTIAVTRSVEVAAKVTGQILRSPDRGAQVVATSYGEVVDMLAENPKAFSAAQRADLREAATADRSRIDELLVLLAEPTH